MHSYDIGTQWYRNHNQFIVIWSMLNVKNLIFLFILESWDPLSGTNCVSWKDAKKKKFNHSVHILKTNHLPHFWLISSHWISAEFLARKVMSSKCSKFCRWTRAASLLLKKLHNYLEETVIVEQMLIKYLKWPIWSLKFYRQSNKVLLFVGHFNFCKKDSEKTIRR